MTFKIIGYIEPTINSFDTTSLVIKSFPLVAGSCYESEDTSIFFKGNADAFPIQRTLASFNESFPIEKLTHREMLKSVLVFSCLLYAFPLQGLMPMVNFQSVTFWFFNLFTDFLKGLRLQSYSF